MTNEASVVEPEGVPDLSVLLVCSANMCRSPIAAALLDDLTRSAGLAWRVRSAGTHVRPGRRTDPFVADVLREVDLQPLTVQTTPLSDDLIDEADLVLTADTRVRQEVVARHVKSLRSTFTLLQFATLCSVVKLDQVQPSAVGPALLLGAGRARQRVQPALYGADDVADPYGQDLAHFRRTRDTIAAALADVMRPIAAISGVQSQSDR